MKMLCAIERKKGRGLNLLSISGGGQNGAFGAGFLTGWSESGHRPQFDMVGGVSTGALLATHALLGTPADDAKLEAMYTEVTKDDIYKSRSIFKILFDGAARSNVEIAGRVTPGTRACGCDMTSGV